MPTTAILVKHRCRVLAVSRSGLYEAQRRSAEPSGHHKVPSLICEAIFKPVWKRKFIHATDSKLNGKFDRDTRTDM